jgi:hypothetical protein
MTMSNMRFMQDIEITFTAPGRYWLNGPQNAEISLGDCATENELRAAVADTVAAGAGDEDWHGWTAARE